MKKQSIPGDIARIMNTVGKQPIDVTIATTSQTVKVRIPRSLYNNIMKSQVLDQGDASGFYLADEKSKVEIIYPFLITHKDVFIKVNDVQFKIQRSYIHPRKEKHA